MFDCIREGQEADFTEGKESYSECHRSKECSHESSCVVVPRSLMNIDHKSTNKTMNQYLFYGDVRVYINLINVTNQMERYCFKSFGKIK